MDYRWGNATYRVRVVMDRPEESGSSSWVSWYDVATLGMVAQREGAIDIDASCPSLQPFPLNRQAELSCKVKMSHGGAVLHEYWENVSKTPVGWKETSLPNGKEEAFVVEMHSRNEDTNIELVRFWFSPRVGNYVRTDGLDGINRTLISWGPPHGNSGPGA
jgi:hypothetical protein